MPSKIVELRERRHALAQTARKLHDDHPDTKWTDKEQTAYDALIGDIERIDTELAREQRVLDLEGAEFSQAQRRADTEGVSVDQAAADITGEKAIYNAWLRGGFNALTPDQRQAMAAATRKAYGTMSTTTDSQGGYLVPDNHAKLLLEAMAAYGGMRQVANILQTADGAAIEWPTVDETSQTGELLAENGTAAAQDPSFGTKTLGGYKYSSKVVAVPFELLQDSAVDIDAWLRSALAERLGRITNTHFTTGTGSSQPNGVVTATTTGGTSASGTAVAYDDLMDLEHSVDPVYRQGGRCRWMFNDSTLKALKKLKDSQNRPLWIPGMADGNPDTLFGHPYTINQDVASIAVNNKAVLFGDFSKYMIRDVLQIMFFRMTDSAYTLKGQVGFIAFSRHDGDYIDAGAAIKFLTQAAS